MFPLCAAQHSKLLRQIVVLGVLAALRTAFVWDYLVGEDTLQLLMVPYAPLQYVCNEGSLLCILHWAAVQDEFIFCVLPGES